MRRARVALLLGVVGACAGGSDPSIAASDVAGYFQVWSEALSGDDVLEVVRYYDVDTQLRQTQSDREIVSSAGFVNLTLDGVGRAWLAKWLEDQTRPRERRLDGVFVDEERAVLVVATPSLATAAVYELRIEDSMIVEQTMLRWRDSHFPGGRPDPRLDWVDDLLEMRQVSSLDGSDLDADIYAVDARITRVGADHDASGHTIESLSTGENTGGALFLSPGPDTRHLVAVLSGDTQTGCGDRTLVMIDLDARRLIQSEHHLAEVTAECWPEPLGGPGWWEGIEPPPPVDEQVTNTVSDPAGRSIPLFNGNEQLGRFLLWGLNRFVVAGLEVPAVESVTFAPDDACEVRAGAVQETGDAVPNIVVCTDADLACTPDRADCQSFRTSTRFTLLHELAHVWMLENIDDAVRDRYLERADLEEWRSASVPWHRRGVEHAAETTAWGLMDVNIPLPRIGRPSCDDRTDLFTILTGSRPLPTCG